MNRPARLKITTKPDCGVCGGRGVLINTKWYDHCIELRPQICGCVKTEFVGTLRLPKTISADIPQEVTV